LELVLELGLLLACAQPNTAMPTTVAVAAAETKNLDAFIFLHLLKNYGSKKPRLRSPAEFETVEKRRRDKIR
jgi:hypothetical protein